MTSKEAFIKIRELMNTYHHYFVKENIKVETVEGYPLDQIEKDLELLEKYKKVMCKPILDIMKKLELLDILKEFLSGGNTGTGWIEININPEHDVLDSEEHKKKQLLIKEWLEDGKNNL